MLGSTTIMKGFHVVALGGDTTTTGTTRTTGHTSTTAKPFTCAENADVCDSVLENCMDGNAKYMWCEYRPENCPLQDTSDVQCKSQF